MKRGLVVIPTFNERESIAAILTAILEQNLGLDVLVVDDGSPDGTAQIVKERAVSDDRIHLIERKGKQGLGTAYVAGFKYAIERGYDYAFEMDADFSHDPKVLPRLLAEIETHDFVLGSRYVKGGAVRNWPLKRLLLSRFASYYTRAITWMPIHDPTGGFKCFRIEVLKAIDLDQVRSGGYSFQIEMNFKAWKKGFRYKEVPIVFADREQGTSKMSKTIIWEAVFVVWKLGFRSLFSRDV
jgi:dolichol-phosphate mannosyltransferase